MKKILVLLSFIFSFIFVNAQISELSIGDTIAIDKDKKIGIGIVTKITPTSIDVINPRYGTYTYYFAAISGIYDYNLKKSIVFFNDIPNEDEETDFTPVLQNEIKNNKPVITYDNIKKDKVYNFIQEDYDLANRCIKAGVITLSIGLPISIIGVGSYIGGVKNNNTTAIIAGDVIMSCGGTLISCSIPLLCFGDNMRRSCNRDFEILEYIDKK